MRQQDANPANKQTARGNPHIVIIGTGFGGLGMAIQLKKAGIESFTVLEKAAQVGGTWRDNSYPGAGFHAFQLRPQGFWLVVTLGRLAQGAGCGETQKADSRLSGGLQADPVVQ